MSEELNRFRESLKLAIEYVNKIVVESDGYPISHSVSDMRTLLTNAFIQGRDSAALGSRGVQEEEPQEEARCQACNSPTFWVRDRFVCPTCGHENGTAKLVAAALRGVGTQDKEPK